MVKQIEVAGRFVGIGQPCFVIAEAGVNHNGSLGNAHELIDIACQAGADAVKFQTFNARHLTTPDAPKANYQLKGTSVTESAYDMLSRLELSLDAHRELMAHCREKGILFLSTPFDVESADLLDDLGVEAFKIPSGEVTNLPFLHHIASKGKPMFVSTGMSYLGEVEDVVRTFETVENCNFILLHCVSNYPADPSDVNLKAMETLSMAFDIAAGYSDHTLGLEVALAAVARGACVIEKHFTLDRNLPGPDHGASLEPGELGLLIKGIRNVEAALGNGRKVPVLSEENTKAVARKSLVAAKDIPAGTSLTDELIAIKRPGTGLSPALKSFLIGRKVSVDIPSGAVISTEMLM